MADDVQLMQHSSTWRTFSFTLMALVLLGASCGDGGEAIGAGADASTTSVIETTTTAPPTTTTTMAAPTPEEEVLAAYVGYWDAVDEAFAPPQVRPDLAGLAQHATGEALSGIIKNAEETLSRGEVYRIPENGLYEHRVQVLSVDDGTATVRDCSIDDTVLMNASTGEIIDDSVATKLYIAMLVREGEQWKLADLNREMTWVGVAGCALEQS